MALPENRIGDYQVLGFQGNRMAPRTILSLDERPGIDGTEITAEGKKGRPFTLVSWVDAPSYDQAWTVGLPAYRALIDEDPVELIVGGVSTIDEGYKVQVLDVRPLDVRPIGASAGGINPPSEAILVVEWDLIAIPIT